MTAPDWRALVQRDRIVLIQVESGLLIITIKLYVPSRNRKDRWSKKHLLPQFTPIIILLPWCELYLWFQIPHFLQIPQAKHGSDFLKYGHYLATTIGLSSESLQWICDIFGCVFVAHMHFAYEIKLLSDLLTSE